MFSEADSVTLDDRPRYRQSRSKRSWATLAELQTIIPYHSQRYKTVLQECKKKSPVTATDLTFATRFVAVFMFVKVKGCRPITYQHFTVKMFENAKTNGGMVDQTIFKTAQKYGFNSLYFDEISLNIIDDYVQYVLPLLNSQCDYLLVNRNGLQFQKLTDLLSVLVFQAIGKYIHLTRYRQIIENRKHIQVEPRLVYMYELKIRSTARTLREFIIKNCDLETLL